MMEEVGEQATDEGKVCQDQPPKLPSTARPSTQPRATDALHCQCPTSNPRFCRLSSDTGRHTDQIPPPMRPKPNDERSYHRYVP